ncbi:MAG: FKBP-type peptidyl-prolyl cis-trans isomerase [Thermodesulfobacteriota bacterium]
MNEMSTDDSYKIVESKCYVKIKYTVRIQDGPVLKGGTTPEIMDFVTGFRHVVPGLEQRLLGHSPGEKLSFVVPPEEAFGIRRPELLIEKDRTEFHFPPGFEPYPGMELPIVTGDDNAPDTVMIREIRGNSIVIDLNHPLAGAPLQYDLEIVEARPARETDMCAEWEQPDNEQPQCGAVQQIVLGGEEPPVH